ncbi:CHAT domain-containing protein [Myxosarcina sp. GI1]|uniref:CHAT domain-containing protein n=1 Tax=Myxosarcina sp. GI1 TaxID=1541065 RepID=UPI0009DD6CE7|nr:CHAT domain-containing protein [Myxosarcina sp. GI1]
MNNRVNSYKRWQQTSKKIQSDRNTRKFIRRLKVGYLPVFISLVCLTAFICVTSYPVAAQIERPQLVNSSSNYLQQGKQLYEAGQFKQSIELLQQAVTNYEKQEDRLRQAIALSNLALMYQKSGQLDKAEQSIAQSLSILEQFPAARDFAVIASSLNIQGSIQLDLGQVEEALKTWQRAETIYQQLNNSNGITRARLNQAQAWQILGFYRRSLNTLTELKQQLKSQPDSIVIAVELRMLGDALQLAGDLKQSRKVLESSKIIAQKLRSKENVGAALLSLGNTAQIERNFSNALEFYREAAAVTPNPITKVQAQINLLSLLVEGENFITAREIFPKIRSQLANLPVSQETVYARLNLAQNLWELGIQPETIVQFCTTAVEQATDLGDRRAKSLALGTLGNIYEKSQQFGNAENYTQQALSIAKAINASDISYRWYWQLGRLLKARGDIAGAITAYDNAVQNLQALRNDLVAVNPDLQYSFQKSVEPVYRESVALLFESQKDNPSEAILNKARNRIEALQIAELDNYFREACIDTNTILVDNVVDRDNPTTAIIYPIILPQQLQVIVKIPQQPLRYFTIDKSKEEVEATLQQIRQYILEPDRTEDIQLLSQEVYNWLIKDIESDLETQEVNTLVFVLDGALRNIPMSVLYDGRQYLIEKYAIALSLGLQLFPPKTLAPESLQVLAAGLVEPPPEFPQFPPLPDIKSEFNLIEQTGVTNKQLLNEEFTSNTIEENVNTTPFNILHLATHGQFSSSPEDTFILAADGAINITQFDRLLRRRDANRRDRSLELLVLSACQTAAGDNRAILGLAGTSVKAGARSTLASLWNISDRGTAILMGEFYRELTHNKVTKAEALRRAQVMLLKKYPQYARPGFWAPYVLVGNWL